MCKQVACECNKKKQRGVTVWNINTENANYAATHNWQDV
jgi:hypothetical protein